MPARIARTAGSTCLSSGVPSSNAGSQHRVDNLSTGSAGTSAEARTEQRSFMLIVLSRIMRRSVLARPARMLLPSRSSSASPFLADPALALPLAWIDAHVAMLASSRQRNPWRAWSPSSRSSFGRRLTTPTFADFRCRIRSALADLRRLTHEAIGDQPPGWPPAISRSARCSSSPRHRSPPGAPSAHGARATMRPIAPGRTHSRHWQASRHRKNLHLIAQRRDLSASIRQ